jgi:hypothetical protein
MATSMDNENISNSSEQEKDRIYEPYKKVYYSDVVGSPILDAVTGAKYPFKVGSLDEKKFFKVRSTMAYKNRSAKTPNPTCASVANQAFYENPQSYMRHHDVVLSKEILDNWNKRNVVVTD